ncbi:Peptidase M50B-like [Fragilaria crotonensis]|nr:Peptidase M50B-like [Fragilaria crotonensis]
MSCDLPDACGNDLREESLIAAQQKDDTRSWAVRFFQREKILLGACLVMIILLNFDTGRYILYPFKLLSTWVHEMSHGTAAILVGGKIKELKIFHDGSGSCYYYYDGATWKGAFVISRIHWDCILGMHSASVSANCTWSHYRYNRLRRSDPAKLCVGAGGQLSTTDAAAVAEGQRLSVLGNLVAGICYCHDIDRLGFAKDAKEMPRNKRQPQYNQEKQVPVSKPTQSTGDIIGQQPV